MCRPDDRLRRHLRLKNRRHRLRFARQTALHPSELRCVERRHLHHHHTNVAFVVNQLAAQRVVKALHCVLRRAIRRLQRNAAVGERGADLHDRAAVARLHPTQRRERSPDVSEVGDLGDAPIFVRLHLHDRREHR